MYNYLSVDVGGTNMTVGLFQINIKSNKPNFTLLEHKAYKSKNQNGILPGLLDSIQYFTKQYFLKKTPPINISACGPTDGFACQPTNLPSPIWRIDKREIEKKLHTQVFLINDFAGIAYSLMTIYDSTDPRIQHIPHSPKANFSTDTTNIKVALGAGTGLGCATLHSYKACSSLISSEGGWLNFSPEPTNKYEILYFLFLASLSINTFVQQNTRIPAHSWEDAISASRGLNNIFHFFCDSNYSKDLISNKERIFLKNNFSKIKDRDRPSELSLATLDGNTTCKKILHFWINLYAIYAKQVSLITLPYGGIFIGGGAASKNISLFLEDNIFYNNFNKHTNPSIQGLIKNIPLYIITEYLISLYGNAFHLYQKIGV